MNAEDQPIEQVAAEHGASVEALHALLHDLYARAGAGSFYVFWISSLAAAGRGAQRQRTLLAFLTPDAALAFAQRNHLGHPPDLPRLRRLSLLQLFQAMLREPAIAAIRFVAESSGDPVQAGQFPHGLHIERAELLRRIH